MSIPRYEFDANRQLASLGGGRDDPRPQKPPTETEIGMEFRKKKYFQRDRHRSFEHGAYGIGFTLIQRSNMESLFNCASQDILHVITKMVGDSFLGT
jgi:hypothetical protein